MPVDMSGPITAEYQKALRRAQEALDAGRAADASQAFRQAGRLMTQLAGYAVDPGIRAQRLKKAESHTAFADKVAAGQAAARAPETPAGGEDEYEWAVVALIHQSPVTWDDIGGLDATKREIKTAYGLSLARPPQGVKLRGWRNILFYGPPGTGKTLLAAATSNGLEATFFNVKVSDMLSKYFGESTRLISALFTQARERAPAVVFLDEIEALVPPRDGGDSGAERRIVSTLLAELDGLRHKGDERYVLTIGATNTPWLIDKAMLSRFERRVYIPLPDAAARRAILGIHIEKAGYRAAAGLDGLAGRTDGYSGRELERLCREAINHMIERANPDLADVVDRGRAALQAYQARVLPLDEGDFQVALSRVKPDTSAGDRERFDRWRQDTE
jgi:SpoVK/Ycf46/Vps4 family AAA+-type ATPase